MAYGPHLVVDAYGCDYDALASLHAVHDLLAALPMAIDMEIIRPPLVQAYLRPPDPEWGVTGDVIIATSHVAIHTYPEKKTAFLDVFSCKPFDVEKAIDLIRDWLEPREFDHQVLERGRKFPR